MNVTCPSCNTIYRVDPAKVPARGVRARCRVCAAIFAVALPDGAITDAETRVPAPPSPAPAPSAPAPGVDTVPGLDPRESWAERLRERAAQAPAPVMEPPPPAPAPPSPPPPLPPPPAPVEEVAPPEPEPRATAPRAQPRPSVAIPPVVPSSMPRSSGGEMARPAAPRPPAAAKPASPAGAAAAPPGKRLVNPFMSQDPQQKAKRLARALISDLVVYYPERRQEGLRKGNLKDVFSEEIKKSWEEYTDQVGKAVAESTSYFTDALNEILAGGQKVF